MDRPKPHFWQERSRSVRLGKRQGNLEIGTGLGQTEFVTLNIQHTLLRVREMGVCFLPRILRFR